MPLWSLCWFLGGLASNQGYADPESLPLLGLPPNMHPCVWGRQTGRAEAWPHAPHIPWGRWAPATSTDFQSGNCPGEILTLGMGMLAWGHWASLGPFQEVARTSGELVGEELREDTSSGADSGASLSEGGSSNEQARGRSPETRRSRRTTTGTLPSLQRRRPVRRQQSCSSRG